MKRDTDLGTPRHKCQHNNVHWDLGMLLVSLCLLCGCVGMVVWSGGSAVVV